MNVKLIGEHKKDSRACRDGLALTLNEMMAEDKSICYVDCDLMGCINTKMLRKNYPDRAFEAGIAEANGAGVAAGLAATGKKVFYHPSVPSPPAAAMTRSTCPPLMPVSASACWAPTPV